MLIDVNITVWVDKDKREAASIEIEAFLQHLMEDGLISDYTTLK
jgi:hypothetical protein